MSTVVLSAIDAEAAVGAVEKLRDGLASSVEWVDLGRIEFDPCLACGGCAKVPRCVLPDEFTETIARLFQCHRLILLTPIFLGVHTPLMKRAIDRLMPLGGGPFTVRQGEMHHESRMERPFSLTGIGLLDGAATADEGDTFRMLIARHAVNLACPSYEAHVARSMGEVAEVLAGVLDCTGSER